MSTITKRKQRKQRDMANTTISKLVAVASDVVAPVWPMKTFIAVNPLQGLEDLPFEQAVHESARHFCINNQKIPARESANRELIKWCTVFFDEGQATLTMPNRHLGFYRSFAELARYDGRLNQSKSDDEFLLSLPYSPEEAISKCLKQLDIPERHWQDFLRQSLAALPGWSGYVKWKENWQNPLEHAQRPASLVEFVAVRLVLTCLLWRDASYVEGTVTPAPAYLEQLPVSEKKYRNALLSKVIPHAQQVASGTRTRPEAQLVFCIDVRSEPFRRAVEARNNYETLGFAGFFGVPVQIKGYDDDQSHDSCPVLLKPAHEVHEVPCAAKSPCADRHVKGRKLLKLPKALYQSLKYNFTTPFALVEMLGPWYGLWMTMKTFTPSLSGRIKESVVSGVMPAIDVTPDLEDITQAQQADYAENALRMMGLTTRFAPLVVLCGHGSTTDNNAFASSLDCGACGGNHGGANARILAAILNRKSIRSQLATRGLPIPDDTQFVAAEHDTTTDEVKLFGTSELAGDHRTRIGQLKADLAQAQLANAAYRCSTFGIPNSQLTNGVKATYRRGHDWAQVRPEWGLARNAAFIVGPREITREVNLEGRCFLHSYDWTSDLEGKYLTTILTAPMVVAQWINSQYLFSTLDNIAYGAGSKVTHNVIGKIGVMQGNASDLMHGLPLQSVYSTDDTAYHEPLRLLTVVYAPRSSLDSIIGSQTVLQKLFGNGWVSLASLDPTDNQTYLLNRDLTWRNAA